MGRDVDHQPLVRPTGERRQQHEMPRRAHRQKLGDSLNGRDDGNMEDWHGRRACVDS